MQNFNQFLNFYLKAGGSMIISAIGLGISFISSIIISRALGPEGRGAITWLISNSMLLATFVQFGMNYVNKRFVAEDNSCASDLILLTIISSLLLSTIFIPGMVIWGNSKTIGNEYFYSLLVAALTLPFVSASTSLTELIAGLGRTKHFNLLNLIQKVYFTGFIILLTLWKIVNPFWVILSYLISFILKFLMCGWWLKDLARPKFTHSFNQLWHGIKTYLKYNYIASIAGLFMTLIIPIILGIISSAKSVGFYAAPMSLIDAMFLLPTILSTYIIVNLVKIGSPAGRKKFKISILIVVSIITCGAVIVFWPMASWLMVLLFGHEFAPSGPIFRILLIGMVFSSIATILQSYISAEDKSFMVVISPVISSLTTIIITYYLVEKYSETGAAISWTFGGLISVVISFVIANISHKQLNNTI